MSQFFVQTSASGPPPPPYVQTSFVTDSGTAIPSAEFILNVNGGTSTVNNTNGIQTIANPNSSNNLVIDLTNRAVGSTSTTGAASSNIITLPLGVTPAVYTFDIAVAGFAKTGTGSPAGCGFTIVGSVRTTGSAATLIPNQAVDHFEEFELIGVTSTLGVSGNSAIVTVTGIAGFGMDWQATLNYTEVT